VEQKDTCDIRGNRNLNFFLNCIFVKKLEHDKQRRIYIKSYFNNRKK
jgi:hypothetical protein